MSRMFLGTAPTIVIAHKFFASRYLISLIQTSHIGRKCTFSGLVRTHEALESIVKNRRLLQFGKEEIDETVLNCHLGTILEPEAWTDVCSVTCKRTGRGCLQNLTLELFKGKGQL